LKIALIVEGPSDKRFFEKLYEQFYRHTQFEVFVRPAGGKPRIFNKAQHHPEFRKPMISRIGFEPSGT
jgi:DNA-binding transcriptional regulator of glucitol operon